MYLCLGLPKAERIARVTRAAVALIGGIGSCRGSRNSVPLLLTISFVNAVGLALAEKATSGIATDNENSQTGRAYAVQGQCPDG